MTTKRRNAKAKSEVSITGVAAGSLGTAANLDDTKVMRTKDLEAAAAAWLDDDAAQVASEPPESDPQASDAIPPEELAPRQTGTRQAAKARPRPTVEPVAASAAGSAAGSAAAVGLGQRPRQMPRQRQAVTQSDPVHAPVLWRRNPSVPALAGVAALFVLLLIAGSGFFSQLDLGTQAGPGPQASANTLIEAAPLPTAEPTDAAKGHGKCHGRGHGNC